jgi:hypothetical protein
MSDEPKDPKDKSKGKLLTFPDGKTVNTEDVGAGYIVGPAGVIPTPELQDPSDIAAEARDREEFIKKQEIVRVVDQHGSTSDMVDVLLKEIAEETSHLKFERDKAIHFGKNTANLNIARINSLRSMTEMLLKRKEADLAERLDLKSPRIQKLFQIWLKCIYEAMEKSGIDDKDIDVVFQQMKANMVDMERQMSSAV